MIEQENSNPNAEGAGNACDRRLWRMQGARVGAAVEKDEVQREAPDAFFGHRKRATRNGSELPKGMSDRATVRWTVATFLQRSEATATKSLLLRQKKTYALIQSIGLFQRNKSLAGFVKYASCVKYCFAM